MKSHNLGSFVLFVCGLLAVSRVLFFSSAQAAEEAEQGVLASLVSELNNGENASEEEAAKLVSAFDKQMRRLQETLFPEDEENVEVTPEDEKTASELAGVLQEKTEAPSNNERNPADFLRRLEETLAAIDETNKAKVGSSEDSTEETAGLERRLQDILATSNDTLNEEKEDISDSNSEEFARSLEELFATGNDTSVSNIEETVRRLQESNEGNPAQFLGQLQSALSFDAITNSTAVLSEEVSETLADFTNAAAELLSADGNQVAKQMNEHLRALGSVDLEDMQQQLGDALGTAEESQQPATPKEEDVPSAGTLLSRLRRLSAQGSKDEKKEKQVAEGKKKCSFENVKREVQQFFANSGKWIKEKSLYIYEMIANFVRSILRMCQKNKGTEQACSQQEVEKLEMIAEQLKTEPQPQQQEN